MFPILRACFDSDNDISSSLLNHVLLHLCTDICIFSGSFIVVTFFPVTLFPVTFFHDFFP